LTKFDLNDTVENPLRQGVRMNAKNKSTSGDLSVFSAVAIIKMALAQRQYMIVTIYLGDFAAKFFVISNAVMYIQPEFREFPTRKVEFRDGETVITKMLSQIPVRANFEIEPFNPENGDARVLQEALKWRKAMNKLPAPSIELKLKTVTDLQWEVIYEAYTAL